MKVRVDLDRCQGHNRCIVVAPEAFTADDLGYSHVTAEEVGGELAERVRLAARNCPERAIFLSGDAGPQRGPAAEQTEEEQ